MKPRSTRQPAATLHSTKFSERLSHCRATVVGLGGLGRLVAQQLAVMGVQQLRLVDAGRVSRSRQMADGYFVEDVGRPKAYATAELCHRVNPLLDVRCANRLNARHRDPDEAVFCCSGSLKAHRAVWEQVGGWASFLASGLVTDDAIRIVVAYNGPSRVAAERRLSRGPRNSKGHRTMPVPFPAAMIAAGLLAAQFSRFLHGRRPNGHVRLSLAGGRVSILAAA